MDGSSKCCMLSLSCPSRRVVLRVLEIALRCSRFLAGSCTNENCSFAHYATELRQVDRAGNLAVQQDFTYAEMSVGCFGSHLRAFSAAGKHDSTSTTIFFVFQRVPNGGMLSYVYIFMCCLHLSRPREVLAAEMSPLPAVWST